MTSLPDGASGPGGPSRLAWRRDLPGGARWALSAGPDLADHTGGDPALVAGARASLAAAVGGDVAAAPDRLLAARQVHGARAVVVRGPWEGPAPEADALVTDAPGLALAVLVADCVPVLLADPGAGVVAVAHAGRRGMDAGVVASALALMVELGADPAGTSALLGPSVCGRCYEVPAAMRAEVDAALPGSASRTRKGTAGLDIRAGLHRQLTGLGVARIGADPRCTMEDRTLYSHRRDGRTGRLAAITWLDPSSP